MQPIDSTRSDAPSLKSGQKKTKRRRDPEPHSAPTKHKRAKSKDLWKFMVEKDWAGRTSWLNQSESVSDDRVFPILTEGEGTVLVEAAQANQPDFFRAIARRFCRPESPARYFDLMGMRPGAAPRAPLFHRIVTACVPEVCQAIADSCDALVFQALCDLQIPCEWDEAEAGQTVLHQLMRTSSPNANWKETCLIILKKLGRNHAPRALERPDLRGDSAIRSLTHIPVQTHRVGQTALRELIKGLVATLGFKYVMDASHEFTKYVGGVLKDKGMQAHLPDLFPPADSREIADLCDLLKSIHESGQPYLWLFIQLCPSWPLTERCTEQQLVSLFNTRNHLGLTLMQYWIFRNTGIVFKALRDLPSEVKQQLLLEDHPTHRSALHSLLDPLDSRRLQVALHNMNPVDVNWLFQNKDPVTQQPYLFSVPTDQISDFILFVYASEAQPCLACIDPQGNTLLGRLLQRDMGQNYVGLAKLLNRVGITLLNEWLSLPHVGEVTGWNFILADLDLRLDQWSNNHQNFIDPIIPTLLSMCPQLSKESVAKLQVLLTKEITDLVQRVADDRSLGRLLQAQLVSKQAEYGNALRAWLKISPLNPVARALRALAMLNDPVSIELLLTDTSRALSLIQADPQLLPTLVQTLPIDNMTIFKFVDEEQHSLVHRAIIDERKKSFELLVKAMPDEMIIPLLNHPDINGKTAWQDLLEVSHRAPNCALAFLEIMLKKCAHCCFVHLNTHTESNSSLLSELLDQVQWSANQYRSFFRMLKTADASLLEIAVNNRNAAQENILLSGPFYTKSYLFEILREMDPAVAFGMLSIISDHGQTPFEKALQKQAFDRAYQYLNCVLSHHGLPKVTGAATKEAILTHRKAALTTLYKQVYRQEESLEALIFQFMPLWLSDEPVMAYLEPLLRQLALSREPSQPELVMPSLRRQAEKELTNNYLASLFALDETHETIPEGSS